MFYFLYVYLKSYFDSLVLVVCNVFGVHLIHAKSIHLLCNACLFEWHCHSTFALNSVIIYNYYYNVHAHTLILV